MGMISEGSGGVMTWEPERVLVIGSNSFTGAHLVDHLLEQTGARVVGVSRGAEADALFLPYRYGKTPDPERFAFHRMDVNRDMERLAEVCEAFRPEAVVNFAAQGEVRNSWRWPVQWYETNCLGVVRVSEFLKDRPYLKRYVSISTPEVYGSQAVEEVREGRMYDPSTPYAVSKLAGDLHLGALHKRHGFPVVYTRAANLYGIHQQLYRIIPRTVIRLKLGQTIDLHGRGEARRAFIHARDVADGTWRALTAGRSGEVYHLAPEEKPRRIADVVRVICGMMGHDFEASVRRVEENFGQDAAYVLNADKARDELGWRPRVAFENGVEEVIRWVENHWETIRALPLDYVHQP
jgi:dTDP-glucose 4,6-dehydratase